VAGRSAGLQPLLARDSPPQNFGQVSVVGYTPSPSRFEFIECTACTTVHARDAETTLFWMQHHH